MKKCKKCKWSNLDICMNNDSIYFLRNIEIVKRCKDFLKFGEDYKKALIIKED